MLLLLVLKIVGCAMLSFIYSLTKSSILITKLIDILIEGFVSFVILEMMLQVFLHFNILGIDFLLWF